MYGMKVSVVVIMVLAAVARVAQGAVFGAGNIMKQRYPNGPDEYHTMEVPEMATANPGVATNLPGTVASRVGGRPGTVASRFGGRPVATAHGPIYYPVGPISSRPVDEVIYYPVESYGPRHPVPTYVRHSSWNYPRSGSSSYGRRH